MDRRDFVGTLAAAGGALALTTGEALEAMAPPARGVYSINEGWRFARVAGTAVDDAAAALGFDDTSWERVNLPHTARLEALVTGAAGSPTAQWQGICWYRQALRIDKAAAGSRIWIRFGAAMNVADCWLDGRPLGTNLGGYTPFAFDITDRVTAGVPAVLAVRLDNRDNPTTGPKPLADLDFNMYGGLYREVELVVKDPLHITDPILADRPASGGLLVQTNSATAERAVVRAQVHVRNADSRARTFEVRYRLNAIGTTLPVATATRSLTLAAGADADLVAELDVTRPALWSPQSPALHVLHTELVEGTTVIDHEKVRIGIRRFEVSAAGLRINGAKQFLRGTNRHQEYPYIGYALSDDAQCRDARLIKEAGFDYIRLSHYLHAPAFMDACDELGILVMNCIPGWQYFNRVDPQFTEHQYENIRRMIRRDRNHACVLLWETSLNETAMPTPFIERSQAIGHEELPGDQTFTCGWFGGYDVFIQARQHGGCTKETSRPCVVSEYGDWEYYAQNAGLNQQAWANLVPDHANSRQLRWHGETRLLQQVTNFQEAHNDNRKTIAFADGLWVMFDYNRGYAPDIESSGCADLFRIPKPSYHFFRSQRDAGERFTNATAGPMVFIASQWTPESTTSVRVFSNADEVALSLNGVLVARQRPDQDRLSTHLAHPPFTFRLPAYVPGMLEATAFIGGRAVAFHTVRTPGSIAALQLRIDEQGLPFGGRGKDVAFLHAALVDATGTLAVDAWENVAFGTTGSLQIIGANPFSSEAGIASALLSTEARRPRGAAFAIAMIRGAGGVHLLGTSLDIGGRAPSYTLRYTTDGSTPSASSPLYRQPLPATQRLQAALCVAERVIARLAATDAKFRVAGSTAPTPAP